MDFSIVCNAFWFFQRESTMDLWMERDYFIGKCKDCAVVRELTSHQYDPGSVPARCHMWVEFVGSRSCSEGFHPGSPVFLPPQKSTVKKI